MKKGVGQLLTVQLTCRSGGVGVWGAGKQGGVWHRV